ncbi:MAG TPA: hypothetical protein VGN63_11270 [Flavisolibacter sp.]|jgi:hypothetical protein|nr:hypothetical protein [Flavisolibacter sp.]
MSLNNISLPSQLVAHLYHHSLVGGNATPVPAKPVPVSFLGKNGKNILIVVNKPDVPYLPDADLSFLTKVLTACQLSLMDVAIVNGNKLSLQDAPAVLEQTAARFVILFDVAPATFGLPAQTPMYGVQLVENLPYVVAPALSQIESSKEAKSQLWTALKQMFGI